MFGTGKSWAQDLGAMIALLLTDWTVLLSIVAVLFAIIVTLAVRGR